VWWLGGPPEAQRGMTAGVGALLELGGVAIADPL
jgi:hypothetical protein